MKMYGGVEVFVHISLTSQLHGVECYVSSAMFTWEQDLIWTMWRRENLMRVRESKPDSSVVHHDWAIPAETTDRRLESDDSNTSEGNPEAFVARGAGGGNISTTGVMASAPLENTVQLECAGVWNSPRDASRGWSMTSPPTSETLWSVFSDQNMTSHQLIVLYLDYLNPPLCIINNEMIWWGTVHKPWWSKHPSD
jgi:hypothetical protein